MCSRRTALLSASGTPGALSREGQPSFPVPALPGWPQPPPPGEPGPHPLPSGSPPAPAAVRGSALPGAAAGPGRMRTAEGRHPARISRSYVTLAAGDGWPRRGREGACGRTGGPPGRARRPSALWDTGSLERLLPVPSPPLARTHRNRHTPPASPPPFASPFPPRDKKTRRQERG